MWTFPPASADSPPVLPNDDCSLPDLRTQELIEHASAGDRPAWAEIYSRYRKSLEPIVKARLVRCPGSGIDAEDVLQSAFLLAWQRLSKFQYQGEGSLLAWITAVTLNKLSARIRSEPERVDPNSDNGRANRPEESDPGPSPAMAAETAEYRLRLIECVAQLDEQAQELLSARLFEELSWGQISARLGLPVSNLRVRLQVAFRKLSHHLAQWEPE